MNEFENTLVLEDEDGNEVRFEFIDMIDYEGGEYAVLIPADDENADTVIILQYETDENGEELYNSVEDEEILDAVFEIFKERAKDEFDFVD